MKNDDFMSANLSLDQQYALDLMLRGDNVFLSGAAGCGKSFVIDVFRRQCKRNCVVVAPTGVAAVNVKGQTIHSFFMLPPRLIIPNQIEPLKYPNKRKALRAVDVIIIDEISMVRSDLFYGIDVRLREVATYKNREKPFGGKQIIVCGDFYQLPPVVGSKFEYDWLQECLLGEYAFQTELWKYADFKPAILKTQFRQKNDMNFASILNDIRSGNVNVKTTMADNVKKTPLDVINEICTVERDFKHMPVKLCTTNKQAQALNQDELAKLNVQEEVFEAIINGEFDEEIYPTDAMLTLKEGARVMVLCNKHIPKQGFLYVNGDVGTVKQIIHANDGLRVIVSFDNGNEVPIGMNVWENIKYTTSTDNISGKTIIKEKVIGTFIQLPLKLAYAMTIHKSQGMTLESVDLRLGNGCFAHGQLYTALSRCRSLSGLKIERNILSDDLLLDKRVIDFYKQFMPKDPLIENNTTISVPTEHLEKVKMFLESLKETPELS